MKILLVIPLSLILAACGSRVNVDKLIQKETVKKGDLRDVITQTGEVQPIVKVELKCESSGRIDTLYVREGQILKKGQKILKIDPTQILTQKNRLDLELQKAQVQLDLAKRDYDNAKELFSAGTVSSQKLQDLKSKLDLAEIEMKDIQLTLSDTDYELSKTLITSPMDGVLISLLVEAGEIAISATKGYSGGTAIGTVADLSKLEVVTQIGEVDVAKIKVGQKVAIGLESNAVVKAPGTVTFVSMAAKKETNGSVSFFEVRANVDSIVTGLVPGVNASVEFILMEKKDVITVPYYMVEKNSFNGRDIYTILRPAGTPVKEAPKDAENGFKWGGKSKRPDAQNPADKQMLKKREAKMEAVKKLNLVRQRIKVGETDFRSYEVLDGLTPGDTVIKALLEKEE